MLDPVERLSEVLFGLIMVLTFTGTISIATADHEEVRGTLIGALGCNLAWGIVDAVMYLLEILFVRGRGLRVARAVRASPDEQHGRALIAGCLPPFAAGLFDDAELEHARRRLVALPSLPAGPSLTRRDLRGALGVFLLVFLSTFPVVLPFLFFSPLHRALRISNAVALVMLFVAGHMLGRHAGLGAIRTGLAMTGIGVVLVLLTIALGG